MANYQAPEDAIEVDEVSSCNGPTRHRGTVRSCSGLTPARQPWDQESLDDEVDDEVSGLFKFSRVGATEVPIICTNPGDTTALTHANARTHTQGAELSSSGSSLTSLTSSMLKGKVEDGRVYAVYGKEGAQAQRSGTA